MPVPLGATQLAFASVAVALGALVQGSVGFGIALVAAPILFMIDPVLVPGPLLCCGLAVTSMMAIRERRAVRLRALGTAVVGLVGGACLGAVALTLTSVERLSLLLGCLVLLAVLLSAAGLRVTATMRTVFLASTMAGFMGTTASIPAPALALVYQRACASRLRGTLSPLLFVSGLVSISALLTVGRFGMRELALGVALVPGVVVGFTASQFAARWLSAEALRVAVLLISAFSACAVIYWSMS